MPRLSGPKEDLHNQFPILRIPTGYQNQELVIGVNKARAALLHLEAIRRFVAKHEDRKV